jgi:hypothetical protein
MNAFCNNRLPKWLAALLGFSILWLSAVLPLKAIMPTTGPAVYGVPAQNLVFAKQQVAAGDPYLKGPFASLLARADTALSQKPVSVMDKSKVSASGDKHDYFSYAPYWWPDQASATPRYVWRDGYVNPESRKGTDAVAFATLCSNVETLGLSYYFTANDAYANKAATLVRVWFLDSATAMNPRVDYGQAVQGISNGRLEGLIEMRQLTRITDGIALIANSSAWTQKDATAFKGWLSSYYDWLTHNQLKGIDSSNENNHLTWRDVQVVQLGIVLGKQAEVREFLRKEFDHLLTVQISRNGEQPRELGRTNSLGYSLFNLEAMFRLATLGDYLGVDCWDVQAKGGANLCAALDALAPYVDPAKPWPVKEVKATERWRLLPLLAQAYMHTKNQKYGDLLRQFDGNGDKAWCLWWAPAIATNN